MRWNMENDVSLWLSMPRFFFDNIFNNVFAYAIRFLSLTVEFGVNVQTNDTQSGLYQHPGVDYDLHGVYVSEQKYWKLLSSK